MVYRELKGMIVAIFQGEKKDSLYMYVPSCTSIAARECQSDESFKHVNCLIHHW